MRSLRPLLALSTLVLSGLSFGQSAVGRASFHPYIVTFESRSFDLGRLHDAILGRDAAAAASEVARLEQRVARDQSDFRHRVEALGGTVRRQWWLINGCAVDLPTDAVAGIRLLPGVREVYRDVKRAPGSLPLAPIKVSTNAENHRADQVQAAGVLGAGVSVAIIDSGLDADMAGTGRPHATFFVNGDPTNTTGGGIAGSRLLANVQVGQAPAETTLSHGTRVAGVAAGARWNATPQSDDGHAPRAGIVGYSIADDVVGNSFLSTMVQAWQQVASDAARYGIRVANLSYEGTFDPFSPEQQAMDAAVEVADLFVAVMAGNTVSSQAYYHSATNVLTVGAVVANSHVVQPFSARGPLLSPGVAPRIYPLALGNGAHLVVPVSENEAGNGSGNGTSFAAPQIAGAAALFRSVATGATADETRAAILATTADVSAQNAATPDAIGHGYLRDDRLIALAQGAGLLQSGDIDAATPFRQLTLPVVAGRTYAVVLSWSRRSPVVAAWSNLDLRVRLHGQLLGESASRADTNERVVFTAPAAGDAALEISALGIEAGRAGQSFAVAAVEATTPQASGHIDSFGTGCAAAYGSIQVVAVEPYRLAAGGFGNAASTTLVGGTSHHTQVWFEAPSALQAGFHARGLALRHDDAAPPTGQRYWVELEVDLGLTLDPPSMMTSTFDANFDQIRTRVVNRRRIVLPAHPAPNQDPNDWSVVIPFDQAFHRVYDQSPGVIGQVQHLIVDVRQWGSSVGAGPVPYPFDAVRGTGVGNTLFAPSPTAATGTITSDLVTAIAMLGAAGQPLVPLLASSSVPAIGQPYTVDLVLAPASASVAFGTGVSNRSWLGVPLPFDLGGVGAAGCLVLASQEVLLSAQADMMGHASLSISVPNDDSLIGARLFHQGLVLSPSANALGVGVTNGLAVTVGR